MDKETTNQVNEFANNILVQLPDAKIYLFGSRARNQHTRTSDYDLIVVSEQFKNISTPRRLEKVYACWDGTYQADILPYTPDELKHQKQLLTIANKAMQEAVPIV